MEAITITPKNKAQKAQVLAFLKELNISFEKTKQHKPKKDKEKEAFLYTSQKNAAKIFSKYL